MALSNAERQARWRTNHFDLDKQRKREWIHKARVEGRVPWSEYFLFKSNPKRGQLIARTLFKSEGNAERCLQLKAIGVEPENWQHIGLKSKLGSVHLEQKHSCDRLCDFSGHSETWVDIEPVAYKVIFHKGGDFGEFISKYWVFKRYFKLERCLDFPEVKPRFKCDQCDFSQEFEHIEDMFLFAHKCPPKPPPVDPLDKVRYFWIVRGSTIEHSFFGWNLRKLYAWIGIGSTTGYGFSISCSGEEIRKENLHGSMFGSD